MRTRQPLEKLKSQPSTAEQTAAPTQISRGASMSGSSSGTYTFTVSGKELKA